MPEMLDIYDDNMMKTGIKARDAVHRDGDWHRVFQCWVIYRDAHGQDFIVVQKRAANKDMFPNKLDISAAGHYASGETVEDGLREIHEELGIQVSFDDLVPLGVRITAGRDGDRIDREFADVFFLVNDTPLVEYQYQREEIAGLVALPVEAGLALFSGQVQKILADAVGLDSDKIAVRKDDFILRADNYVYRVLILAKRCLNGEAHLVI